MLSLLKRRKRRSSMKGVFCLQHKNIKGAIFIPTNGNRDSRPGKIFACRIWNLGIFLTNPKSWALESRISLSRLESGNVIQVPKTRNLELIQYLEYRMNDMKYRIQDYLGLTYSNYHVSFCFDFDFLSGKKKKKS